MSPSRPPRRDDPSPTSRDRYGYPDDAPSRAQARRVERARAARRRRRIVFAAVLVTVAALGGAVVALRGTHGWTAVLGAGKPSPAASANTTALPSDATPSASATPTSASTSAASAPTKYTGPVTGPGTFTYATTRSPVLGTSGTLHRFKVAVENGTGQNANAFAATAVKTLGDPRSWIAGGNVRLQQVPQGAAYDFILYLATPGTSERMCAAGGLHTEKYTSCRITGQVIINLARWLTSVPDYNAPLEVYQQYAINHEVGHELGHGHEACPGPGQPAPVMQQQTYGLKGCVANAWPYLNGKRYAGAPIP
ncbi:MAG TPA: DUF3152 domain-containing protein [Micromonosporaceae bacterium]